MPYNLDKDNIESESYNICEFCGYSWCECEIKQEDTKDNFRNKNISYNE